MKCGMAFYMANEAHDSHFMWCLQFISVHLQDICSIVNILSYFKDHNMQYPQLIKNETFS